MHDWAQAPGRPMKRSNVDAALLRTMVSVFLSEYAMVQRAMVWTRVDRVVLGPRQSPRAPACPVRKSMATKKTRGCNAPKHYGHTLRGQGQGGKTKPSWAMRGSRRGTGHIFLLIRSNRKRKLHGRNRPVRGDEPRVQYTDAPRAQHTAGRPPTPRTLHTPSRAPSPQARPLKPVHSAGACR